MEGLFNLHPYPRIGLEGLSCPYLEIDDETTTPIVAYSLRQLSETYTGKAINVRRSSDSTTMDIGFVAGALDVATLLTFCGSGNGYVAIWYNQGSFGSSGNATQAAPANQPSIVTSGVLNNVNGLFAVLFTGNQILLASYPAFVSGAFSTNAVSSNNSNGSYGNPFCNGSTGTGALSIGYAPGYIPTIGNSFVSGSNFSGGASTGANTPYILTTTSAGISGGAVTVSGYTNGTSIGTASLTGLGTQATSLAIGNDNHTASDPSGYVFELMLWASIIAGSTQAALELNQASFYKISGVTQ